MRTSAQRAGSITSTRGESLKSSSEHEKRHIKKNWQPQSPRCDLPGRIGLTALAKSFKALLERMSCKPTRTNAGTRSIAAGAQLRTVEIRWGEGNDGINVELIALVTYMRIYTYNHRPRLLTQSES